MTNRESPVSAREWHCTKDGVTEPCGECPPCKEDAKAATATHRTTVTRAAWTSENHPLFEAKCTCGWESEYLASDPEASETDAVQHLSEATR